jgi:phospholipid/cholesterol/gamma-HCH transport system substrate-binding protein
LDGYGAPPRSEQMKKYLMETIVGIFVVFGLLCIAYMSLKLGHVSLLGDNSYSIFARFTSVSGLRVGNPVNMLGLEIGRVERLNMDQEDQKAVWK